MVEKLAQETLTATATAAPELTLGALFKATWWIWVIALILLLLILYILYRVFKKSEEKEDVVLTLFNERKTLCQMHRNGKYYSGYFSFPKNAPIICQHQDKHGQIHRKKIGYYFGDYYSKEKSRLILFAKSKVRKWFFFPVFGILILNKAGERKITEGWDEINKKPIIKVVKMDTDLEQFGDEEIIIKGMGVDKLDDRALFHLPVLRAEDGSLINASLFESDKIVEVIQGEYLFRLTNDYVKSAKKALDVNQEIRKVSKLGDSNQSAE